MNEVAEASVEQGLVALPGQHVPKTRSGFESSERWLRLAAPFIVLALWELIVRVGLLDRRFFPAPSMIVADFIDYAQSGQLLSDTVITLQRIVVGFVIGAVPGTILGLIMGINRWVRAFMDPIVSILYPIPKIAILPLVLLIFGIGEASKYSLVAIGVFFLMLINTEAGVRQIEKIYLDVAKAYRIKPLSFYVRVLLPGALPNVFAGVKLSIGVGIILGVAAEFTAAKSGLGFTIWNGWQTLQVERMYVALVMVSMLGFILTALLDEAEKFLIPWLRG
jgi:ABC-type nitrate/sulfonate/bicarbonate transport system permease component